MSRRRRRARNVPRLQGIPLVIIQVLLGAMLAIAIGVLLGKLYISRILDAPPAEETEAVVPGEPAEEGEEQGGFTSPGETAEEGNLEAPGATRTMTTTVPALPMYRVQAGAFSQEKNAEGFLAQLEELGFEGMILAGGGVYRVNIGLFTDRKGAQEFAANLVAIGDLLEGEPLVVAETLAEKNLSHEPQEEEYFRTVVQVIEKTGDIAGKMEALWLSYLSGEKTPVQVLAEVEGINGEIKALGDMVQLESPSGLSYIQEEVSALPADLTATLKELQKQVEGGGKWAPFPHSLARLIKLWPQLN
jgi:hypothetical protein